MKSPYSAAKILFVLALSLTTFNSFGQLIFSAEVRPRAEFRNGFKTLAPDTADPAFSISQRTRFNLFYKKDKLTLYVSLQDVRTWGDVTQLNVSDKNAPAIQQAWAEYQLSKTLSLKLGRQEVILDNHRIFGNVGWAQQARSHDLALLKYKKNKLQVELGLAYNQDGQKLTSTDYALSPFNYKTMQYVWAHNDWDKLGVSVLILNNGLQYIDKVDASKNATRFSQTLGTYITKKANNFKFAGTFYYQMGKDIADRSLNAFLAGIDINWVPKEKKIFAGLGFEMQSGNDLNWRATADSTSNSAFTPFFGTNHKFNGLMDYFYVGNHINSVGLIDFNATIGYKFKKSKIKLTGHNFMSAGSMIVRNSSGDWETKSSQLGMEFDLVYIYPINQTVNLKMGYSQMIASESMELLKSTGPYDGFNNWAWVMITFKPELFRHEYKKPAATPAAN